VEDNPTDIFIIEEILRESGLDLRLDVVKDGQDALTYLRDAANGEKHSVPALVLLDLNLPKVSGIEVLTELRNDARLGSTPVVIVSSSMAPPDRLATKRLGAAGYFQKPNDLTAYRRLIEVIRGIFPN
jgi:two-component system, chemotaxis family, response regulator Rcp1